MPINKLQRRPLLILILLLLFFLLPMFAAWFIWKNPSHIPTHTTNRGQLIQPAVNLNELSFYTENETQKFSALNGKWLLLYVTGKNCDQQCQKIIYLMRQIQTATGKNQARIQRMILTINNQISPDFQKAAVKYPPVILAHTSAHDWQQQTPSLTSRELAISSGYLYLLDPKGFMVLGYSLDENPSNILKDLEKLLKVSQIG